tara:strand:- start:459 stop:716 length:258 start_codon:yes stop_codon:yes gene_type:complete
MSSEVHKYIENALNKKQTAYQADVIEISNNKNFEFKENFEIGNSYSWKLYDKNNSKEDGDQLKAVIGICFMFTALALMGLYSSLT